VALALLVLSGCCLRHVRLRIFPPCADGLPVKLLLDPACPPDGVCGYSCLPDRWKETEGA
jgi:hypothetical protein